MLKLVSSALLIAATLTLAACGKSDSASDAASAENVEMPAEEAMSSVDVGATPVADASATPAADASAPASDAAAAAPSAAADAAEKATADAEKKM
jgi:translation elongation factor EF-Tu-like GTPase